MPQNRPDIPRIERFDRGIAADRNAVSDVLLKVRPGQYDTDMVRDALRSAGLTPAEIRSFLTEFEEEKTAIRTSLREVMNRLDRQRELFRDVLHRVAG